MFKTLVKGCYVYCVDDKLSQYLRRYLEMKGRGDKNDTGNN